MKMRVNEKADILKQYFGYSTFRLGQEEIIDSFLSGRDALAVMPTGAGKSICYQVPALMMDGVTLVISPLVSLMKDQVNALITQGVKAAYLNRSLNDAQFDKALENIWGMIRRRINTINRLIKPERSDENPTAFYDALVLRRCWAVVKVSQKLKVISRVPSWWTAI